MNSLSLEILNLYWWHWKSNLFSNKKIYNQKKLEIILQNLEKYNSLKPRND